MRNNVVHEEFSLPDRKWFIRSAQILEDHLVGGTTPQIPNESPALESEQAFKRGKEWD